MKPGPGVNVNDWQAELSPTESGCKDPVSFLVVRGWFLTQLDLGSRVS